MKKLFLSIAALLAFSSLSHGQSTPIITEVMSGGRIVDGKEIILSELPFFKGVGRYFSVMIVPKVDGNTKEVELINAKYFKGASARNIPIQVNQWNSVALIEITSNNSTLFSNYYVYVGFGSDIPDL